MLFGIATHLNPDGTCCGLTTFRYCPPLAVVTTDDCEPDYAAKEQEQRGLVSSEACLIWLERQFE